MSEHEDLGVNKEKRKALGTEGAEYGRISASTWSEQEENLIKTEGINITVMVYKHLLPN